MSERAPYRLFEAFGIELEYMIVHQDSLDVLPKSEHMLKGPDGTIEAEIEVGDLCWSKELVCHVIELKTNGPVAELDRVEDRFQTHVQRINEGFKSINGMLLPSAIHPWMNPMTETRIWPHHENTIFQNYDRIFGCKGHGWSNLQSMHLNLPFGDDNEFGRLHAAIRLVLPIIPALAASSPIVEGRPTGKLDNRMFFYRENQRRIPSIAGKIIPEAVFSGADYRREILERSWADIAPYDPEGLLRYEWLNSRGCIARFDRDAIEIRIIDIQECPKVDIAVAAAVSAAVRALCDEKRVAYAAQKKWPIDPLASILWGTAESAENFVITDEAYLRLFGYRGSQARAGDLWAHIIDSAASEYSRMIGPYKSELASILKHGTLATRIIREAGDTPDRDALKAVFRQLADCLEQGRMFL